MFSADSSILLGIWDSSVGIVARLWAGPARVQFLVGTRDFIFSKMSRPALGPTHPIWWAKYEVDGLPLSRTKVKNEYNYIATPCMPPWCGRSCLYLYLFRILSNMMLSVGKTGRV
jgi:hypothetical protein